MEVIQVSVHNNLLNRIASIKEVDALKELVYNSLDASATKISITIERNKLGGVEQVKVMDNGNGIEEITENFSKCGYSLKTQATRNALGKLVHGKKGEGRFKAYRLGTALSWLSKTENGNIIKVIGDYEDKTKFSVLRDDDVKDEISLDKGTIFTAENKKQIPIAFPKDEQLIKILEAVFSNTLSDGRIQIVLNGTVLDAKSRIKEQKDIPLEAPYTDVKLRTILWKTQCEENNRLFWCNEDFQVLEEDILDGENKNSKFSIYLASAKIAESHKNNTLELNKGMEAYWVDLKKKASDKSVAFVAGVEKTNLGSLIDSLKRQKVYPYDGAPKTKTEEKSKEIFDIVLSKVNEKYPSIISSKKKEEKKIFLTSLKTAIEQDPRHMEKILKEVLQLGTVDTKGLSELLERVKLSNVIKLSRDVANKVDCLDLLYKITYGEESKYTKERIHLHKIIEKELWLFGNAYQFGTSDKAFTTIIEKIRQENLSLGKEAIQDEEGNTLLIPDLFLYQTFRNSGSAKQRQNLLIELKRPRLALGMVELMQVQKYANVIAAHPQLKLGAWDIFLISSEIKTEIQPNIDPKTGKYRAEFNGIKIYVRTWAEIIEENKWILSDYQGSLDIEAEADFSDKYFEDNFPEIRAEILANKVNTEKKEEEKKAKEEAQKEAEVSA